MNTPGSHVPTVEGHTVFEPCDLQDWDIRWTDQTRQEIELATHAIGLAAGSSMFIPNPEMLTLASLDKEAIASSTIENTVASPEEFVLYQAVGGEARSATVEVANYRDALVYGERRLNELPISTRLVLELHQRLLHRTPKAYLAGKLKTSQNYIASDRSTPIERATFVPPPPDLTVGLLDRLWSFVHEDRSVGKLAKIAMTHYQFETIHPFGDGNGRVGRILVVLQLLESRLLDRACVYPSLFFEQHKDEYLARLQAVRDEGDLDQWVGYFARAIRTSAQETVRLARSIVEVVNALDDKPTEVRRRAALQAALRAFSQRMAMTAAELATAAKLSEPTAQSCLRELAGDGIVREITGRRKGRVYVCQPLFRAIFSASPPEEDR